MSFVSLRILWSLLVLVSRHLDLCRIKLKHLSAAANGVLPRCYFRLQLQLQWLAFIVNYPNKKNKFMVLSKTLRHQ